MDLIVKGKTKDVYDLGAGNLLIKFKDDMTGEDGKFDPGANTVGLTVKGAGRGGLKLTDYFFRKINEAGYATHFVTADIEKAEMVVKRAEKFGKGLEVICRFVAYGSFIKRYGDLTEEGKPLDALVEVTIKADERGDPPISADTLAMLGILSLEEYEVIKSLTQKVSGIIRDILKAKSMDLYDIKFEFGRIGSDIVIIDEISGGCMRVFKDGKPVDPMELVDLVLN